MVGKNPETFAMHEKYKIFHQNSDTKGWNVF